jgi:hypothetical protein
MKGFFLILMIVGLLITSFLVVKNLSTHQSLKGDTAQIEAFDRAKETAARVSREANERQKRLNKAMGE